MSAVALLSDEQIPEALSDLDASTPFQTAGWLRAWTTYAASAEGARPILATTQVRPDVRVAVPLQLHQQAGGPPVFRPLGWPWADYHETFTTGGQISADEQAVAVALALDRAQACAGADLELSDVRAGGPLHHGALRIGALESPSSPVLSLDLSDHEHWHSVANRAEVRRKRRLLESLGKVRLREVRDPAERVSLMPVFVDLHRVQWQARTDVVAPFDGGVVDQTFLALAAESESCVVISSLEVDEVPVAMYFGFELSDTYWAYRTTYDVRLRRLSPGRLLVAAMLSAQAARGLARFDLMRGDYPYKHDYANERAHNVRLVRAASSEVVP